MRTLITLALMALSYLYGANVGFDNGVAWIMELERNRAAAERLEQQALRAPDGNPGD